MNRVVYLDGIRIISSLIVFISHSIQIFLAPKIGYDSTVYFIAGQCASYSVVVFFILSGYMVTNSIINNKNKNGFFDFGKYWKDRLLRIYPPLIFSIILSVIVYSTIKFFHLHGSITFRLPSDIDLAREKVSYSFNEIIDSLFFVQGINSSYMNMNGPLWSLGDEFFLYVIASLISLIVINNKKIISISILIIFFVLVYKTGHLKEAAYLYVMWGIGAFFSIEKSKPSSFFTKNMNPVFCVIFFISLIITISILDFKIPNVNYKFLLFISYQLSILLFVIFLFRSLSISARQKIINLLEFVTPKKDYTYTLYVIHWPILIFVFSVSHLFLNSRPIYTTLLLLIFTIPIIVFVAIKIANYVESKSFNEKIYQFFKNN